MKLTDRDWKTFEIEDLFSVEGTVTTIPNKLILNGNTPRITCAATNNALDDFYSNFPTEEGGVITIDSATTGYISFQEHSFIATDHVEKVVLKEKKMNRFLGLFLKIVIESATKGKYEYGYKFSQKRIQRQLIQLPINNEGLPDYQFMEDYTKELIEKKKAQYRAYAEKMIKSMDETLYISSKKWQSFIISDIFEIKPGKRLVAANSTEGERPFIGALDNNNGIARFVSNDNVSKDKNVLGVNYNGNGMVIGFYHPYECIFSDDVKRFHLKHYPDNEYVLLFMKALILKQKSKFGYLYKFNADRMAHTSIMIPVDDNGNPDYAFMEQYGKMLVARKYQQYLDYLDSRKNI